MPDRPLILIDPLPRTLDVICEPEVRQRLDALGRLVISEDKPMAAAEVDRLLPEAEILIGQTDMPKARLDRAPKLKAIFNVETNFLPNIDYREAQARGIWVLSPTSSFASAVAESSLAMAIDLARGITAADRAFRAGRESYGLAANAELHVCRCPGRHRRLRRSWPVAAVAAGAVPQPGEGLRPLAAD